MLVQLLVSAPAFSGTACKQVSTVGSAAFDLDEWVRASWYIQEQQITKYLPLEKNYCCVATCAATLP